MTSVIIETADRALVAGAWLERQRIKYKLICVGILSADPKYYFRFNNPCDAIYFKLKWQ
jgi:hypothetical protein